MKITAGKALYNVESIKLLFVRLDALNAENLLLIKRLNALEDQIAEMKAVASARKEYREGLFVPCKDL